MVKSYQVIPLVVCTTCWSVADSDLRVISLDSTAERPKGGSGGLKSTFVEGASGGVVELLRKKECHLADGERRSRC